MLKEDFDKLTDDQVLNLAIQLDSVTYNSTLAALKAEGFRQAISHFRAMTNLDLKSGMTYVRAIAKVEGVQLDGGYT